MVKTYRAKFIRAMTMGEELKLEGLLAAHLQVQKPNMISIVYDPRFYQIGYEYKTIFPTNAPFIKT